MKTVPKMTDLSQTRTRAKRGTPARRTRWPWVLMPVLALPPGLPAQTTPASANGLECVIQPSQLVQVGTATSGIVQSVKVERGDPVRRGQALVLLDSQVERAALAVAREKAAQAGEAIATRGASELAQRELERAADLVKENFVSRTFYDRQRAEVEVASGRGQQAEEKRRLASREVELAAAQLAQRTVVSPVDGVVVERHVSPGEYVEQKPVLKIASIDPLRVDVLVPAHAFGQIAPGRKAKVMPEMLHRDPRTAVVTSVDRVVDAASHTFRVRLEMPNPGGKLPPGLRCKADLDLQPGDAVALRTEPRPAQSPAPAPTPAPASTPVPSQPLAPAPGALAAPASSAPGTPAGPLLAPPPSPSLPSPPPLPSPVAQPRISLAPWPLVPVRVATQTIYDPPPDALPKRPQLRPTLEATVAVAPVRPTGVAVIRPDETASVAVSFAGPRVAGAPALRLHTVAALQGPVHPRLKLTWVQDGQPLAVASATPRR